MFCNAHGNPIIQAGVNILRFVLQKDKGGDQSGGKTKYVLLKHIQTNIFDQMNDLHRVC